MRNVSKADLGRLEPPSIPVEISSVPSTASLLGLPAEVRCEVYDYLVAGSQSEEIFVSSDGTVSLPAIARTCRHLRNELQPLTARILQHSRRLTFHVHDLQFDNVNAYLQRLRPDKPWTQNAKVIQLIFTFSRMNPNRKFDLGSLVQYLRSVHVAYRLDSDPIYYTFRGQMPVFHFALYHAVQSVSVELGSASVEWRHMQKVYRFACRQRGASATRAHRYLHRFATKFGIDCTL